LRSSLLETQSSKQSSKNLPSMSIACSRTPRRLCTWSGYTCANHEDAIQMADVLTIYLPGCLPKWYTELSHLQPVCRVTFF
jgi:hypothetical protein